MLTLTSFVLSILNCIAFNDLLIGNEAVEATGHSRQILLFLHKEDNVNDTLFAFPHTSPILKKVFSLKAKYQLPRKTICLYF